MDTAMLNGAQPFCSDTTARQGQPDHPAYMVAGEAATQWSAGAAGAAHSTTTIDPTTCAAPAAPTQAHAVVLPPVHAGGAHG